MFGFGKKQAPQNVNDLSERHFVAALVANESAKAEAPRGTVAGFHLPRIARQQMAISDCLDKMLEANKKAGQHRMERDVLPRTVYGHLSARKSYPLFVAGSRQNAAHASRWAAKEQNVTHF